MDNSMFLKNALPLSFKKNGFFLSQFTQYIISFFFINKINIRLFPYHKLTYISKLRKKKPLPKFQRNSHLPPIYLFNCITMYGRILTYTIKIESYLFSIYTYIFLYFIRFILTNIFKEFFLVYFIHWELK